MKKSRLLLIGTCTVLVSLAHGQQPVKPNEFKLGIFGATSCKTHLVSGCDVPFETPLDNGFKTSVLNVLAEDGFNIYQTYAPNEWTSENFLKSYLKLSQANNFKVELGAGHYYKPAVNSSGTYLGYGTNVYNNCSNPIGTCQSPYSQNYFRANINNFINNVYTVAPYKDIIWGYHMCEEASYYHPAHFANNCQGNIFGNPSYFKDVEIPPTNVNNALSHFKTSLSTAGITKHKMVVMEANHHKNINPATNDGQGTFNPQQYIQLLSLTDARDVFFEGSYTQFPATNWLTQSYNNMFSNGYHYLGPFRSIDYAKTYSSEVHKVINIEGTSSGANYLAHFHSNLSIPNANWLWFQAYTSIIHGAKGIWFWDLNFSWNLGETNSWNNTGIPNRYDRGYFPLNYRNYTSHLAKELRFLSDKNILSTDMNTIVATKTDSADPNCIVPPVSCYIPSYLPSEKQTENYGLRYTIRSNGAETYMIITNPLNVVVSVTLDFSQSANQHIQNSTGVYVLFDADQFPVASNSYKVNRNSNINLTNGTVGSQYYRGYTSNKKLAMSFGPMDVKVLRFVSAPPNYNNGWNIAWSNYGSGKINGHVVHENDRFYIGDFDGDGTEELLCVGASGGSTAWVTMLKYKNDNWEWHWSNYGSSSAGNGMYLYRDYFIVGDYDGDGKDELFGNYPGGWTTMFKFDNGDWQWMWSDYGNTSHAINPYKDKFYPGDFNGDGKDELLGCGLPNGWTTSFKWNGSDFIWDWSDYGSNHGMKPYRANMLPGDFDGDGKTELLGLGAWATLFHFDASDWQWGWSNYGANNFNGWSYPLASTDAVLSGNLDADNKDELFFLQTHFNAGWATTMDLKNDQSNWNWNWSANPSYSVPFIDDWSLAENGGSNTKYYLVKAKSTEPKYLLAMRKFCENMLVNMYKTNSSANYIMPLPHTEDQKDEVDSPKSENSIDIFPNPSAGKVQIVSSQAGIIGIETLDMKGQTLYSENYNSQQNIELDLSRYPAGIYLLKLTDSRHSVSIRRIILNK